MQTQVIGDIRIDRIVDMEGPFADLGFLIPDAPPDLIARHADWLKPLFIAQDDQVVMSFHSLLIRTPRKTILVDACIGNDKQRPERPAWHKQRGPWLDNLRALGVAPEDIDLVTCTHLHADHVGWNTKLEEGRWVPTFPNARYVFARREYEHWEQETARAHREAPDSPANHGSWDDSVLPVMEAGQADLVDSDFELETGIWMEPAEGHTPGNIVVNVEQSGQRAVLMGDVLHTAAQLTDPALSSRFCTDPVQSATCRCALVDRYAETDTRILTAHFPSPTAGRIERDGNGFRFQTRLN